MAAEGVSIAPLAYAALLTLVPLLLMGTTSFAKIYAVLSFLRNALGAPHFPSAWLVTLWSLLLTSVVMAPVADEVASRLIAHSRREETLAALQQPLRAEAIAELRAVGGEVIVPLKRFLRKHADERELALFLELAKEQRPDLRVDGDQLSNLMPAFLLTELREALAVVLLLWLPFVVIDLLLASVLQAASLGALNPATLALPLKLLLFLLVDGFHVLSEALVRGYF